MDGERFFVKSRFGKRRNTVCISRFSNRRIGGKDPSSAVGDLIRGSLVSLSSLSKIQGGSLAQKGGFFQSAADFFDRDVPALRRACEALGGTAPDGGDAAFELALFPFLPVVLRFWRSDEEFPASLQFLLPENVLSFMHYETMMFALSHVADRLRQRMES